MRIEPFRMERWQSTYENEVEINLSDSGVSPMTIGELVTEAGVPGLMDHRLVYTQSNGTRPLRDAIAGLYEGATEANVEATNGGAEANFVAAWTIVKPGDEVVMQIPNYMQLWGMLRGVGAEVKPWKLIPSHEAGDWTSDLDELEALVGPKTKMICLCNPNNPAGSIMDAATLDRVAAIAAKHDAWVLVDEIYHGTEQDGEPTPTMWGRHDKVVITNSFSKTYGLPGLRLGWILAPADTIADCWSQHDYMTIGPGSLSNDLGIFALSDEVRPRILARTKELLTNNLDLTMSWVDADPHLKAIRPKAGAYLMMEYDHEMNSSELSERLRVEKDLLLVPGDHFGMDGWLRVGYGEDTDLLARGLARIHELLETL